MSGRLSNSRLDVPRSNDLTSLLSDGASGVYSQIVFLIVWPIIAICSTPLIGLVLALLSKQTTPRELWVLGRRRGDRGLIDAVLLQYAVPLTMLILLYAAFSLEPRTKWSITHTPELCLGQLCLPSRDVSGIPHL